jgi:hypothetical protein
MADFEIVSRRGKRISSVAEWAIEAKPAKAEHWQDGRSAKELAKAWINGSGPAELIALLDLHRSTAGFRIERAVAEAQTAFDRWPGGKRNHDLHVTGEARGGRTTIGLEGKADETFGQTVKAYAEAAQRLIASGKSTNAHLRLADLTAALGVDPMSSTTVVGELGYQLFTGVAGTLAAAERDAQAVFVVHEFITEKTNARLRAQNQASLAAFTECLFAARPPADISTWLLGPFHVPAERWAHLPLWIGKIATHTIH